MQTACGYKDLVAWQKGMELVQSVYGLTRAFPAEERFGLTSQVRRAAVSIPGNIAEGYGRSGRGDYVRFLDIALGSANEVETYLLIAVRLSFATEERLRAAMDSAHEVQRLLKGLTRSLEGRRGGTGRHT